MVNLKIVTIGLQIQLHAIFQNIHKTWILMHRIKT